MKKKKRAPMAGGKMFNRIWLICSALLILLMVAYLAVSIYGAVKINWQTRQISEHPYQVAREADNAKDSISEIENRVLYLLAHSESEEIADLPRELERLYLKTEDALNMVKNSYLGPEEDIIRVQNTFDAIKAEMAALQELAGLPEKQPAEVAAFEADHLSGLFRQFKEEVNVALDFSEKRQESYYETAANALVATVRWSVFIVVLMIAGLLFFQYILRRLNREIIRQNQIFDMIAHTVDDAFMVFEQEDPSCEYVTANIDHIAGLSAEALEEDWSQLYKNIDAADVKAIHTALLDPETAMPWETMAAYKNPKTGEDQWLSLCYYRARWNRDDSRTIVRVSDRTQSVRDQQALKDALVNAQNANSAKRDFLSRMSHEIRTPMNAIIGMATIAAASLNDPVKLEDCMAKIGYSSRHLLMLINDILDMSRIESNKLTLNEEPFELYQYINSLVAVVYPQAQERGLTFTEKITGFEKGSTFIGDSLRLNQILLNLLSNALKFTGPGGSVSLEIQGLRPRDGWRRIRFKVSDTGIGMDEEGLSHLYTPFEQADASISGQYGGTGLGMSITQNLVSLMGGHIDVKSTPGQGTVFTVELAFQQAENELEALSGEALSALKVLVVDDERDMCEHTALLLSKMQINARWALSGAEAVDWVTLAHRDGEDVDVCFIDWKMPDMDGIETTRRIRAVVGPDTPIVIITAYEWSEIEQEAREAGVNAFVSKPLFLSSVYNTLVSVTSGRCAKPAAPERDGSLSGYRILVADDNSLNLEITGELLGMHGAAVETVANGLEALERFEASAPGFYDAILLDVQMPVMDGHEAARRIRKSSHPEAGSIPLIAATANAFNEDKAEALAAGMNAHVSKPIDVKELCRMIRELGENRN